MNRQEIQVLNHDCILLQIYGDPDAADIVFTSGADIVVVGINITTQVCLTGLFIYVLTCTVQGLTINSSIMWLQMRISWI
jgi:hypothetical protein